LASVRLEIARLHQNCPKLLGQILSEVFLFAAPWRIDNWDTPPHAEPGPVSESIPEPICRCPIRHSIDSDSPDKGVPRPTDSSSAGLSILSAERTPTLSLNLSPSRTRLSWNVCLVRLDL
jgi:hypothetical protein